MAEFSWYADCQVLTKSRHPGKNGIVYWFVNRGKG